MGKVFLYGHYIVDGAGITLSVSAPKRAADDAAACAIPVLATQI